MTVTNFPTRGEVQKKVREKVIEVPG